MGSSVSPSACISISASDVPGFACSTSEDDPCDDSRAALSGIEKRFVSVGETGSAVRFACFFRILRVASVVANWNCKGCERSTGLAKLDAPSSGPE